MNLWSLWKSAKYVIQYFFLIKDYKNYTYVCAEIGFKPKGSSPLLNTGKTTFGFILNWWAPFLIQFLTPQTLVPEIKVLSVMHSVPW